MAWKPIPVDQWRAREEQDFWAPLSRKRSDFQKLQMVRKQGDAIKTASDTVRRAFAARLAHDEQASAPVQAQGLMYLCDAEVAAGNIDTAIEHAMLSCEKDTRQGLRMMVHLICAHDRRKFAADGAALARRVSMTGSMMSEHERDLHVALLLALAGDQDQARTLADCTLDELAELNDRLMYGSLTYALHSRELDRALFKLTRRGGKVRFVGLLDEQTTFMPDQVLAKLKANTYFREADIESHGDRLTIDLSDFSLDIRWTKDDKLMDQVQRRYRGFKYEDRVHIPDPPAAPHRALIVLAIGDDDSKPEIINPLVDFVGILDAFGECIFYDRVGPLSRRSDVAPVEPMTIAQVDKLIRSRLRPLFKDAGFEKLTSRRFVTTTGPLGFAAAVHLRIDKQTMRVEAQLQLYYRDILEDGALLRYHTEAGEFRPRAFNVDHYHQYKSEFVDLRPDNPGRDAVTGVFDELQLKIQDQWLPAVHRARDPRRELAHIVAHINELGSETLWPSRNRFGASTVGELALAMARMIGAEDLAAALANAS